MVVRDSYVVNEFSWRIADDQITEILINDLVVGFISIADGVQDSLTIVQNDFVTHTSYIIKTRGN